jgi:hypothetical protein
MAPSATCRLRHPAPLCLQPPAAAAAATPGTLLVANRESLCVVLNRENRRTHWFLNRLADSLTAWAELKLKPG